MQLLARLYEHALARQGPDADHRLRHLRRHRRRGGRGALAAAPAVRMVVLFPEGRISEVQRRFMTTAGARRTSAAWPSTGRSTTARRSSKACSRPRASRRRSISPASIRSTGRASPPRAVYYFTAAAALGAPAAAGRLLPSPPATSATPSPAMWRARWGCRSSASSWRPTRNDILARAFQTGRYARGACRRHPVAGHGYPGRVQLRAALLRSRRARPAAETSRAMRAFADAGGIDIPPKALAAMREVFVGARASEAETARAIVSTYQASGELIDPHTAVAVHAAGVVGPKRRTTPMVALATAHPAKFPRSVENASGAAPPTPRAVKALAEKGRAGRSPAGRGRGGEGLHPRLCRGLSRSLRPTSICWRTEPASSAIRCRAWRRWRSPSSSAAARCMRRMRSRAGRTCSSTWCSRPPATARRVRSSR